MADTPMRARAAAAHRLPPLASGLRDPLLEITDTCYVCQSRPPERAGLVWLFGHWMCRDRVECYQRYKGRR